MRRSKSTIFLLVLVLIISLLAFAGCGGSQSEDTGNKESDGQTADAGKGQEEVYVMKLSHATRAGGPRDLATQAFKEKVETATNGRIKVDLYPNSQLGNNVSVMQGLQIGTIEAQVAPTAYMSGFEELFGAIDLSYLWPNMDVALDVLNNSQIGADLAALSSAKDIYIAAFWPVGERCIITTDFAVKHPDDLQGHKMRVMDDPLLMEMFKSWGATAVPMAFDELYNGLQQGIVQGFEVPLATYYEMKLYEVAKNLTFSEHGIMLDVFYISKPWFNKLPQELQQAINKAAMDSVVEYARFNDELTAEAIEKIKMEAPDVVFHEITEEAHQAFSDRSQRVHQIFSDRSDAHKQLVDDFKKAIAEF